MSEEELPENLMHSSRLSDRILYALELALEQEDLSSAETLKLALETAMTRNTGGGMFIERRDYPDRVQSALDYLVELKHKQGAA